MSGTPEGAEPDLTPGEDVLEGAEAIAAFLWGPRARPKKVYRAAEQHQLPVYYIGNRIHARRSTLMRFIREQEARCRR